MLESLQFYDDHVTGLGSSNFYLAKLR